MKKALFLFFALLLQYGHLLGQENDTLGVIGRFQQQNNQRIEAGKLAITPLLGPSYTPEMSLTLAGGAMISFLTDRDDPVIQRSSAPVTLGVSVTGAYFFSTKLSTFWKEDKFRIFADLWLKNMPDHYWGVGYDNAYSVPQVIPPLLTTGTGG